jgi:hypothetical protein
MPPGKRRNSGLVDFLQRKFLTDTKVASQKRQSKRKINTATTHFGPKQAIVNKISSALLCVPAGINFAHYLHNYRLWRSVW